MLALVVGPAIILAVTYPRSIGASLSDWLIWAAIGLGTSLLTLPYARIRVPWMVPLVLAWCGASILWSQNRHLTVQGVVLYGVLALLAFGLALRVDDRVLPLALGAALLGVVTLSVTATLLLQGQLAPGWKAWFVDGDLVRSFQGLYGNRNIVAYTVIALVPAAFCLSPRVRTRIITSLGALLLLVPLMMSVRSSTGMTALVILVGLLVVDIAFEGLRRRTRRVGAPMLIALSISAVVTVLLIVTLIGTAVAKKTTTLSGRTPLWEAILRVSREEPLTGFGWTTVWKYHWLEAPKNSVRSSINEILPHALAHGHNAALDVLPQIGLVGVTLFVALQVRALVLLLRAPAAPVRSWALMTLVAINVVGVTEPMWTVPIGWFMLVLVATVAERQPRKGRFAASGPAIAATVPHAILTTSESDPHLQRTRAR